MCTDRPVRRIDEYTPNEAGIGVATPLRETAFWRSLMAQRRGRDQITEKLRQQRPGHRVVSRLADNTSARERGAAPDAVSPMLEQGRAEQKQRAGDLSDGSTARLIESTDATNDTGAGSKIVVLGPDGTIRSEQG